MKTKTYIQSCQTDFWQRVFERESEFLLRELQGIREVLSIGCGPAMVERKLVEQEFCITGLDISKETLSSVPDLIRTVVASAEDMPFAESSFDAVIFIASLQFMNNYKKAIHETARVLRSEGKLVAMLLNPESSFFKEKYQDANSYIQKIKHLNIHPIEATIVEKFEVKTKYFLGIKGKNLFESQNQKEASLYIIKGIKRP